MQGRIPLLAAVLAILFAAPAGAAEYDLKLAHYLPPTHNMAANVLPEWAHRIEEQSGGRIHIELYPAGQLLKINEIYDGVRSGVADIGWGLPAINAGRFPRLSTVGLPFLFRTAEGASRALMDLEADGVFDPEFRGLKVLYLHTHTAARVHTREQPVRELADFEGLRIRFPSPIIRDLLSAYGAEPVGVPAPQVYENLEKGVLDGVTFPYEAMKGLRLGEQVHYHTDVPLYVLPFYLVMNRHRFESLPEDLQQIIMRNSGKQEAVRVARSWDAEDARGREYVKSLGNEIVELSEAQRAQWEQAAQPVIDSHLRKLDEQGIDGRAIYRRLKELADRYE